MYAKLQLILVFVFSIKFTLAQDTLQIANGTKYVITKSVSKGRSPKRGDLITMKLEKYNSQGNLIFSTDMMSDDDRAEMTIYNKITPGDILEVFMKLKPGESATAYVPIWVADNDTSFRTKPDFYKYRIELFSFISHKQKEKKETILLKKLKREQKQLFDSISATLYPDYRLSSHKDGLYILRKAGQPITSSEKLRSGEHVNVHYTLYTLPEMIKIDNSLERGEPLPVTIDSKQLIKGWDMALQEMKKGDDVILLVPSWLGYGFMGSGGEIGPNTPLYFKMKILE